LLGCLLRGVAAVAIAGAIADAVGSGTHDTEDSGTGPQSVAPSILIRARVAAPRFVC
jgi:hypothetical protein